MEDCKRIGAVETIIVSFRAYWVRSSLVSTSVDGDVDPTWEFTRRRFTTEFPLAHSTALCGHNKGTDRGSRHPVGQDTMYVHRETK